MPFSQNHKVRIPCRETEGDATDFEGVKLECGYRIDIVVENKLVIEVKACEALHPIHLAQTLTYLRLGSYRLGLLINFNVEVLRDGIRRVINGKL